MGVSKVPGGLVTGENSGLPAERSEFSPCGVRPTNLRFSQQAPTPVPLSDTEGVRKPVIVHFAILSVIVKWPFAYDSSVLELFFYFPVPKGRVLRGRAFLLSGGFTRGGGNGRSAIRADGHSGRRTP